MSNSDIALRKVALYLAVLAALVLLGHLPDRRDHLPVAAYSASSNNEICMQATEKGARPSEVETYTD